MLWRFKVAGFPGSQEVPDLPIVMSDECAHMSPLKPNEHNSRLSCESATTHVDEIVFYICEPLNPSFGASEVVQHQFLLCVNPEQRKHTR